MCSYKLTQNSIAKILNTDVETILSFDSKQVFNQYNNQAATANGVVQNQQIIADQSIKDFFSKLNEEICLLYTSPSPRDRG